MQIAKLMGLGALVCVGVAGATLSPPAFEVMICW